MRYAGMIKNDVAAAPGICVTFFTQGCPHKCEGCHNPETWDFNGGKEFNDDVMQELLDALSANGINRNLCIQGGEPLCKENIPLVEYIIDVVKGQYPNIKIYIWTGYVYENIKTNLELQKILNNTNVLIDGPYIAKLRDITLPMRGSWNQRIINLKEEKDDI